MDRFFSSVQKRQEPEASPNSANGSEGKKTLPKGVVLGKDGKPCRSCTSFAAWAQMTKSDTSPASKPTVSSMTTTEPALPSHCPPDVETLGRSTWAFLHTLTAAYPEAASSSRQNEMKQFLSLFSKLYPCWHCAEDFQDWMSKPGNEPKVQRKEDFGRWMCEAHNEVNRKLGKKVFNCSLWRERWDEGPKDGSCG